VTESEGVKYHVWVNEVAGMAPNVVVLSNLNRLFVMHWVCGVNRVMDAVGEGITVIVLFGEIAVHPLDGLIVTKAEKFPNFA